MMPSIFHLSLSIIFMVIVLPARVLFSQYHYILGEKITLDEIEPPDNYELQVFMEEEEAIGSVFKECDEVLVDHCVLDAREKRLLGERLKTEVEEDAFNVFIGKKQGKIQRYAIIIEETGCFHPITFIMSVEPDGKVDRVAVMIYRESRGKDVVRDRFLHQYRGRSVRDPIQLNKDIINITGATTSVRGVNRGVRKGLEVLDEFYLHGSRNTAPVPYSNSKVIAQTEGGLLNEGGGQIVTQAYFAMDDIIEIVIAGATEKKASNAFKEAFKEAVRLEKMLNKNIKNSELSRINQKAKKRPIPCSAEIANIIESATNYSELTDGWFDITEGALIDKLHKDTKKPPSPEHLKSLLNAVSYKNIVIDARGGDADGTIFIKERLTDIDLLLVAKGYVIDRVVEVLRGNGIAHALVGYGGNIRVIGAPPGGSGWRIAIPDPVKKEKSIGFLEVSDMAVAISGDREKMIVKNRREYPGIANINADTVIKRPFDADLIDAIVIAPTAFEADALAAAVFLSGMDHGVKLIEKTPGVGGIDLYKGTDGNVKIEVSDGINAYFTQRAVPISSQRRRPACAF